MIFNL